MERSHQPLVVGLAAALGVALLAIAYLLGLASTPPAVVTVAIPAQGTTPAQAIDSASTTPATTVGEAVAEPGSPSAPAPAAPAISLPADTAPAPSLSTWPGSTLPPASGAAAPASPERSQVAAYFQQVEGLADMGAGDPQAFAASMMQSVSSGDFSGFDDLLKKARDQRQRLQAIAPPRPCTEYHRLALKLSGDSVSMLERLKAALMKGDSTALMTIATEGKTLETQTGELKSMGETIKRQAGL